MCKFENLKMTMRLTECACDLSGLNNFQIFKLLIFKFQQVSLQVRR